MNDFNKTFHLNFVYQCEIRSKLDIPCDGEKQWNTNWGKRIIWKIHNHAILSNVRFVQNPYFDNIVPFW